MEKLKQLKDMIMSKENKGLSKKKKVGEFFLFVVLIVSTIGYVINKPPSIEYLKKQAETYRFDC